MHRLRECPEIAKHSHFTQYSLLDSSVGPPDVEHFVLRSPKNGALQYFAKHLNRIISAYPALCYPSAMLQTSGNKAQDAAVVAHQDPDARKEAMPISGGGPKNLATSDKAVQDCVDLFHRTADEKCGKDFSVEVLNAVEKVIDGLSIEMQVKVDDEFHDIACDFETAPGNTDAQLLQGDPETKTESADGSVDLDDQLPEETRGLTATLAMEIDLCKADKESTTTEADIEFFSALAHRPMGELSRYKGFEHVNDDLPVVSQSVLMSFARTTATDVDLREKFPACFPDSYKEAVRDQGQCGSCWAFASASATMNNLCTSAHGNDQALATTDDRFEVSVQQIMSCNSDKVGCDGGYASAANDAMTTNGITQERMSPYKCGGGDPLNHFDASSDSCKSSPWGGKCDGKSTAYDGYNWGGAFALKGEEAMAKCLVQGFSLYSTLDVYGNFMNLGSEIYTETTGGKKGGHALATVGYGTDSGTPYWVLQNSWGTTWGVNGYGKMLKGKNIAGIEEGSYFMRAWVSEADKVPPCFDSDGPSGSGWVGFSCETAAGKGWCTDSTDPNTKKNCPVACDTCPGGKSGSVDMATPEPKVVTAAPTKKPAPTTCEDDPEYKDPYFGDSCALWKDFTCTGQSFSDDLLSYCPLACKTCKPAVPKECQDDPSYTDPDFGDSCLLWQGFTCDGFGYSKALKEACPSSCKVGKCQQYA
jgi:hypothetical protein